MRILVISQYFYPENFRINQLCLDLKEKGHKVTVLTGKPNYPKGEYFDGYDFNGNQDEEWNGIKIIRVPLRARKKGSLNLVKNYLSFVYHANKKVNTLKNEFDVVYVFEVSPITVALPAIKFKKKHNTPIIMNVQDLWPDNIVAVTGINNPLIIGYTKKLVKYIYKNCDLLLCSSASFISKISDLIGDNNKTKFWPQYATVKQYSGNEKVFDPNKFNITFTGNIGEAQGIDIAIEVAKELKDTNLHWHLIGDGRNKIELEELVKKYSLEESVTFHGFINEEEIPKYLASSNAALLILKPNPVFDMTIPAKLQTYLSCGVPILGCVSGESKKIIEEADCGIVSNEVSKEALLKECKEILNFNKEKISLFTSNGLEYSMNNFQKEKLLEDLERYMEGLTSNKREWKDN